MPDFNLDASNQGTLEVGSFIGGTYRVLDFIGQGGMGFVYKVEHLMMAKVLALKVLRSEQVSEEVWKRFRIEAQAIARLDHANVVRIYDMSQTEAGLPYYTMDLLVGESLADYLDEYYRLPVKEALPIFRQVCAGLAYAHDRGIIHRDIKPGNIMLLRDGRENAPPVVKIVDFGIAKLSSFDSGFGQGLTRPGEVFGSPLYMSPEQCSGQQLDHRTDMYSVGVTMFQALTGRPPLLGKTAIETTAMHQSVVPPTMAEVIDLEEDEEPVVFPSQLEEIVARLLAKAPDARYDSLADVASELLALERGDGRRSANGLRGQSNLASEVSARRAANAQSFSGSQIDTGGDGNAERQHSRTKIVVLAVGLLLACSLAAAAFLLMQTKAPSIAKVDTPLPESKISPYDIPVPAGAFKQFDGGLVGEDSGEGQVDTKTAQQIKAYLSSHTKPYSSFQTVNGELLRVFSFPSDFRLGSFAFPRKGIPSYTSVAAIGRVPLPASAALSFHCAGPVKAYPDLLKYFRADELTEIDLNEVRVLPPQVPDNLKRFTRLGRLELKGTTLRAADIEWLDELGSVRQLAVDDSHLPGAALAQCRILPRLTNLGISRMDDPTPVLKKLAESNNLKVLEANFVHFDKEDILYISRLKGLTGLCCKESPIDDEDVEHLANLKELKSLNLARCNSLTPKVLPSLFKMRQLEELVLPDTFADNESEKLLHSRLPKLIKYGE
jgi:serine/threonine protein kinase